jgi:hypothetical protein
MPWRTPLMMSNQPSKRTIAADAVQGEIRAKTPMTTIRMP